MCDICELVLEMLGGAHFEGVEILFNWWDPYCLVLERQNLELRQSLIFG